MVADGEKLKKILAEYAAADAKKTKDECEKSSREKLEKDVDGGLKSQNMWRKV